MATIKDVANLAGVSFGTVSNVVNGKRVSAENRKKVQAAIKELNYSPNANARSLKTSRTMTASIIVPTIDDPAYAKLFTGIERVLNQTGYTATLYTTSNIPVNENRVLDSINQQKTDGVIIVTCQPNDGSVLEKIEANDLPFVIVERELISGSYNFVGFEEKPSLYNEIYYALEKGVEDVSLVIGPQEYTTELKAIEALNEAYLSFGEKRNKPQIIVTEATRESAFKSFIEHTRSKGNCPEYVFTTSTLILEGVLQALHVTTRISDETPTLVSLGEDTWMYNYYPNTKIIPRQTMKAGEMAAEILIDFIHNPMLHDTVRTEVETEPTKKSVSKSLKKAVQTTSRKITSKINVLLLEGNAAQATESLLSDFESSHDAEVEITALKYEDLYTEITSKASAGTYDVFQIDLPWFAELAYDGYLLPLDGFVKSHPELLSNYVPGILDSYARLNDRFFALPYLIGTQLLFFRKDVFDDPDQKFKFSEIYGRELSPPKNWTEFNAIASFFTRSINQESPVEYGTTLGASFSSGAVCEFLPRMWSYKGKPINENGKVDLYSRETVHALENYIESFKFSPPGSEDNWWDEQVTDFSQGRTAMMILFVAHATDITNREKSKIVGKIGYAPIPGNNPILGGWSLGINQYSKKQDLAFDFLSWVSGRELAIPHTILGGATPSMSLYKSSELVDLYPWLPMVLEEFSSSRKRAVSKTTTSGKMSDWQFEHILGKVVNQAVKGILSPEKAIQNAHKEMAEIIEQKY